MEKEIEEWITIWRWDNYLREWVHASGAFASKVDRKLKSAARDYPNFQFKASREKPKGKPDVI